MIGKNQLSKAFEFLDNYFFIIYLAVSWVLLTTILEAYFIKNKSNIVIYTILMCVVFFIFILFKRHPLKAMGLTFKNLLNGKMFLYILPFFLIANAYLIIHSVVFFDEAFIFRPDIGMNLFIKIFGGPIRTIGEEVIFRGWLFIKPSVHENNRKFWKNNMIQAGIFTSIHALISFPRFYMWCIWVVFVFALSLAWGWLNRKFNSIWPSALLHSTNGLYRLFLLQI